jgi:hypothetical protein
MGELIKKAGLYLRGAIASETSEAIAILVILTLSAVCLAAFLGKRIL